MPTSPQGMHHTEGQGIRSWQGFATGKLSNTAIGALHWQRCPRTRREKFPVPWRNTDRMGPSRSHIKIIIRRVWPVGTRTKLRAHFMVQKVCRWRCLLHWPWWCELDDFIMWVASAHTMGRHRQHTSHLTRLGIVVHEYFGVQVVSETHEQIPGYPHGFKPPQGHARRLHCWRKVAHCTAQQTWTRC